MPGWSTIKAPVLPSPVSIFKTPFGKHASLNKDAALKADRGVYSAGFKTIVLPLIILGIFKRFIIKRKISIHYLYIKLEQFSFKIFVFIRLIILNID